MALDLYINKPTLLHRLHPITKMIGLFVMLAAPFSASDPRYVLIPFALAGALAIMAGAAGTVWRVKWLIMVFFFLSLVLWGLFTREGEPLFNIGGLTITSKGALFGATVGLRLDTFFLAAIAMLSSTPTEDMVYALSRMGAPYPFAFALSLSFRLVPLFLDTAGTVVIAQRARGLDLDSGNALVRARRYIPILLPVLFLAILRTNRLAMALESKGFGPGVKRTRMAEHRFSPGDAIGFILIALLGGLALAVMIAKSGRL